MSQEKTSERLMCLLGNWQGTGEGNFPTIDSFRYREELHFENDLGPFHYEQRTWLIDGEDKPVEASHWESGFLIVLEDGRIRMSNAQSGGRVEVLEGFATYGDVPGELVLELTSIAEAGDARMIATRRHIRLSGESLDYEMGMHTDQTQERLPHLSARLKRV